MLYEVMACSPTVWIRAMFVRKIIMEKAASAKKDGNPILENSLMTVKSNLTFPKLSYPRFLMKCGSRIATVTICPSPVAMAAPRNPI